MNEFYREYLDADISRKGTNCEKWDRCGEHFGREDLIAMWVADMDFRTVPAVAEAIQARAQHAIYGYTENTEAERLAEIGWLERRHRLKVEPSWMLYSPGVVDSLFFCVQALTSPGDGVVIQPPVYGPFFEAISAQDRKVVEAPLTLDADGWRMDYAALERESARRGEPLLFFPVAASALEALRTRYPDAEVCPLRDWYDYLYNASDMAGFPGKRFHGQRSHVNKFDRLYPDWRFEPITAENLPAVRAYFEDHAVRFRKDESETALAEEGCVRDFLEHYFDYGGAPQSGVLFVGDRVIGFSCGEIVGDTLIIHIEKADTAFDGAYQKLVCEYAKMYAGGVRYINREEDLGDPGMRQSKERYHPVALLEKYLVRV